jgi:hypothetical protein
LAWSGVLPELQWQSCGRDGYLSDVTVMRKSTKSSACTG